MVRYRCFSVIGVSPTKGDSGEEGGEMGVNGKVRLAFDGVGKCLYIAFPVGTGDYLL